MSDATRLESENDDDVTRESVELHHTRSTLDQTAFSNSAPGASIGPYRLLENIGEGGMGEVWLAEQRNPVRRRVAIKLIKAGMDTREVVARFESERQALALMDQHGFEYYRHGTLSLCLSMRR